MPGKKREKSENNKSILAKNNPCTKAEDNDSFNVAVIATMSSGKSTTLNAMLGVPLLPSKNEACTSTVFKIEDVDGLIGYKARLIKKNGITTDWEEILLEKHELAQWNNSEINYIELQGDFPNIWNYDKKMRFFDTPGPNNSTDKKHSEITEAILQRSSYAFLMCVMNASQFGVEGETKLLLEIQKKVESDNMQSKILFLLNRVNDLDLERECLGDLLREVNAYLKDLGFKSPIIIPLNSLLSLNIRRIINSVKHQYPIPFSVRKQKRIIRELEYVEEFKHIYKCALTQFTHYDDSSLDRMITQSTEHEAPSHIVLGDSGSRREFSIKQLKRIDLLTGIPVIETELNATLELNL